MLHDEPIYLGDEIIGRTTSANYSFNFNKNLAFGYIQPDYLTEDRKNKKLFIEIEKKKYPAEIIENPLNQKKFRIS